MKIAGKKLKAVLILAAMEVEEDAILRRANFEECVISEVFHIPAHTLRIDGKLVILARCGVGLVNAATTFALIAEKYEIDAAVLLGVGGAVTPELEIGEVVLAKGVIQHDSFSSDSEGDIYLAPGTLHVLSESEEWREICLPCSSTILSSLEKELKERFGVGSRRGVLLSGSEFVGTAARKLALAEQHEGAMLVDMEAAGVAQIAKRLQIPFVVAKTVADRVAADGSIAHEFEKFVHAAAENSAAAFDCILSLLSAED